MLSKVKQQKFITKAATTALVHLDMFSKTRDAESLHQFRVEIKKIRSLLWLIKKHAKHSKLLKCFTPTAGMFKKAGAIRGIDINRSLVSKYPGVNQTLLFKMQKQRDGLAGKFVSASKNNKQRIGRMLKKGLPFIFELDEKFITGRIRKQFRKISETFTDKKVDPDKYHNSRKKIKTLLYASSMFSRRLVDGFPVTTRFLDKTQQQIGDWHDSFLAAEYLAGEGYSNSSLFQKLISDTRLKQQKVMATRKLFLKKIRNK